MPHAPAAGYINVSCLSAAELCRELKLRGLVQRGTKLEKAANLIQATGGDYIGLRCPITIAKYCVADAEPAAEPAVVPDTVDGAEGVGADVDGAVEMARPPLGHSVRVPHLPSGTQHWLSCPKATRE